MSITESNWSAISKLLDQALDIPANERDAWLDTLTGADADLKPVLRDLLARHAQLEKSNFLDDGAQLAAINGLREDFLQSTTTLKGAAIGPYRLVQEVGRGGMGSVWRAERADGRYEGAVAIKFVHASWIGNQGESRFRSEGKLLARFDHPNIARLIDAGVLGQGQPYLVLEFVDGEPINQYCARHGLNLEARVGLFLSVLAAVAHAHSHLIVHRDLKPANIFVTRDGTVKLLDFGIAKLVDASSEAELTKTSMRALTPQFAAPEQLLGQPITTAVDVYALGLVLYTLLTGTHPVAAENASSVELQRQILSVDPQRPSSVAILPEVPPRALRGDLDNILGKALKKLPAERYASVNAFADDLGRYLKHEPIQARPESLAYHLAKFVRRHRRGVAAAVIAAVAVLAGIIGTVYQAHRAEANAKQAARARERAEHQLAYAEAADEMLTVLLDERTNKTFTPEELQARGRQIINAQFADNAELRARMLLALANTYGGNEESGAAAQLYADARTAAASLNDAALQAEIDCSIANEAGDTGDTKRSLELYDSAIERLRADENVEPAVLASCLSGRSEVRILTQDPASALPDAQAALKLLGQPRPGQLTLAIDIHTALANIDGRMGRSAESIQEYGRAAEDLKRTGRGDTEFSASILNDYGVALAKAGQLKKAAEIYSQGLAAATASGGATETMPTIQGNYAKVLIDLGRIDQSRQLFSSAIESARRRKHGRAIMMNVLMSAPAWCERGDLAECSARLVEAGDIMKQQLPEGSSTFGTLELEQAQLALAQNRPAKAREHIESALKIYASAKEVNGNEFRVMALRPSVDLLLGDKDSARQHAADAVRRAQEATKGFSSSAWLGSALLAQGLVYKAVGENESAMNILRQAADQLRESVGDDAPATRMAIAQLQ